MEPHWLAYRKGCHLCKGVLNRNWDEQGRTGCYRGSLVAKSYGHKDGVDYDKAFALVTLFCELLQIVGRFTSVRCHAHHANISTAFLNRGDIDGEL